MIKSDNQSLCANVTASLVQVYATTLSMYACETVLPAPVWDMVVSMYAYDCVTGICACVTALPAHAE